MSSINGKLKEYGLFGSKLKKKQLKTTRQRNHKSTNEPKALPELIESWLRWKSYYINITQDTISGGRFEPANALKKVNAAAQEITEKKIHTREIPSFAMGYLVQQWNDADHGKSRVVENIISRMAMLLDQYPENKTIGDLVSSDENLLSKLAEQKLKTFETRFSKQIQPEDPDKPSVIIGQNRAGNRT